MPRSPRRLERITQVLAFRQPDLTVVMENIHDPHNVSAVLRSCDAAGVMRVELVYTLERFPRIGKKSSSSANKWIDVRRHRSARECLALLKSEGFTVYATRLEEGNRSLYDLDLTRKVALVLGNEHRGVSDDVAALADGLYRIPMMGMIRSLNVSVACAVSLYEALRQRLAKGGYGSPKIGEEERRRLFDDWTGK